MAGFLADGIDYLNDVLDDQIGVDIVYSRANESATLTAGIGQTVFERDGEFGVLKIESRDYLITSERLTDAGFGEPKRGDRITETQGDDSVTYEVLDQPGIQAFSYSDQSRKRMRIHTKRISTT